MPTAIEFDNVGKQYRLGLVSTQTLSHDLHRWWTVNVRHKEDPYLRIGDTNDRSVKGSSDYVWALKDISFKVEQGDVVGIIGRNGAGKSTLLKLLSKVTGPTTGQIRARGRIGSLLEVGTGFHPEMTGRENIFMNGAILGMTKAEVARKLDEIVDFSGCERYLDTPVKRYSSGMMVRLGFAVAAHLDPEILVVDEVLAVGDAEFQKKAIGKMKDVSQGEGRTVLFVSHNMASVRALCHNALVLSNGIIAYAGDVESAVDYYSDKLYFKRQHCFVKVTDSMRDKNRSREAEFVSFEHLKNSMTYASDEDILLHIVVHAQRDISQCRINCTIKNNRGTALCNNSSLSFFDLAENETKTIEYRIHNPGLVEGTYSISFSIGTGNMSLGETNFDVIQEAVTFEIDRVKAGTDLFYARWSKESYGEIYLNAESKVVI